MMKYYCTIVFRYFGWQSLLILMILSCSASKFGWKEEENGKGAEKTEFAMVEDFDPLSLEDEDIIIIPRDTSEFIGGSEITEKSTIEGSDESKEGVIQGYRVQLLATKDESQARGAKYKEAIFKFPGNVYLVFEAPLYKIRIGDCKTRREAEELRKEAVRKGFRDAWIVPSRVRNTQRMKNE